ncbi:hypothetical protein [Francisella tularensis]|uniref:hypothetical protein n=1 Tax=Francisella tularensis TaxID=263 RepID=UPI000AC6067B|nr:hypothetical protein [Francisella tularensis]
MNKKYYLYIAIVIVVIIAVKIIHYFSQDIIFTMKVCAVLISLYVVFLYFKISKE